MPIAATLFLPCKNENFHCAAVGFSFFDFATAKKKSLEFDKNWKLLDFRIIMPLFEIVVSEK